jgi:hypothetical protein
MGSAPVGSEPHQEGPLGCARLVSAQQLMRERSPAETGPFCGWPRSLCPR